MQVNEPTQHSQDGACKSLGLFAEVLFRGGMVNVTFKLYRPALCFPR